jgi:hypothetical protein
VFLGRPSSSGDPGQQTEMMVIPPARTMNVIDRPAIRVPVAHRGACSAIDPEPAGDRSLGNRVRVGRPSSGRPTPAQPPAFGARGDLRDQFRILSSSSAGRWAG